jgi:Fe-S-cluster-containing hydrogenase component 2/CRP-like cAMP-binding protein
MEFDDYELYLSDEPTTARNADGRVRVQERDTKKRQEKTVSITLDGIQIPNFPEVVPARDERGLRRYKDGLPLLRFSTIYDVGRYLVRVGIWSEEELNRRIPVLCHREYFDPIAVCRMCAVSIETGRSARKLSPACQHRVGDGFVVHTRGETDAEGNPTKAAQEIERAQKILTQLLMGDHFHPHPERDTRYKNELSVIASLLNVDDLPFPRKPIGEDGRNCDLHPSSRRINLPLVTVEVDNRGDPVESIPKNVSQKSIIKVGSDKSIIETSLPYSSRTITVDHENCILCDRCVRACTEIKKFRIIGHTGKGNKTRISFDLDMSMDDSDCVQCGECMTNCPTGALVLKRRVRPRTWEKDLTEEYEDPSLDLPIEFVSTDEFELLNLLFDADAQEGIGARAPKENRKQGTERLAKFFRSLDENLNEILRDPKGWNDAASGEKMGWLGLSFPGALKRTGEDVMLRISASELNSFREHFEGTTSDQLERISALFQQIPYPYLRWNEGAIRYRPIKKGELICKLGDFGSTAYLLMKGKFQLYFGVEKKGATKGFFGKLFSFGGKGDSGLEPGQVYSDEDMELTFGKPLPFTLGIEELIFGEMACLTSKQRTATIRAAEDGVILEVTRNVLDMIQRSPAARPILEQKYKERALDAALRIGGQLFEGLNSVQQRGVIRFLSGQEADRRTRVRRVERGEVLLKQGAGAGDFYIIRYGFVKVVQELDDKGNERILNFIKAGMHFGEIAILSPEYEDIRNELEENQVGRRLATCTALDDVEVIVVPTQVFRELCCMTPAHLEQLGNAQVEKGKLSSELLHFPIRHPEETREETLGKRFAKKIQGVLRANKKTQPIENQYRGEFVQQGLFQGQKLLILDLLTCTRCDECTRACADSHDGFPRLLRDGQRFGDFLVATTCRSCHKPYCMDGCPVDAIHRTPESLEIKIENHCIGCGLCERQCPYGSIHMAPTGSENEDGTPKLVAEVQPERRAVNCNLCEGLVDPGQDPFCVAACPHDAAFRWDGEELLNHVNYRATVRKE